MICCDRSQLTVIPQHALPLLEDAVLRYEREQGVLTRESLFGADILAEHPSLQQKRSMLLKDTSSFYDDIFTNIVSSDRKHLEEAILKHFNITSRLSKLIG